MRIEIPKTGDNLLVLMRRAGYSPDRRQPGGGEQSFSRVLGGSPYPKFHIYAQDTSNKWILKLHLDQNRPRYEGTAAHGGEYDGPLVEQEARRIENFLR